MVAIHSKDPREYCVVSKEFVKDSKNRIIGINTIRVEWTKSKDGKWSMHELPGTNQFFKADLVLLAMVIKSRFHENGSFRLFKP